MYCPECGTEIGSSDNFCRDCGRDLTDIDSSQETSDSGLRDPITKETESHEDGKKELDIEPLDTEPLHTVDFSEDEVIYVNEHPHHYRWALHYFIAGLFIVLGIPMLFVIPGFALFVILVLGGGILFYVMAARQSTQYIVTDQRVIKRSGFANIKTQMIPLDGIASIGTTATVFGGESYGNVSLSTTTAGGDVKFRYIPSHKEVVDVIRKLK